MFPFRDHAVLPIGVDIGTHSVRMLQMRRVGERLDLIAAARTEVAPLDPKSPQTYHDEVTQALRTMRVNYKFQGNQCVSALAPDRITCKSLRMPQMPESDVEQAIRWEAKDRLGFELTDGQLAYFRSGEVRRGSESKDEFLLFAATSDTLTSHIQQFTNAGLKIVAIDLQPCALLRALERINPPAPVGATALIDLGVGSTQFMVTQEDRLVFYKNIEIGDQALCNAVAQKLGIPYSEANQLRQKLAHRDATDNGDSPEAPLEQACFDAMRPLLEDLARELDLCLRYYGVTFRGTRPETIHASGGQSYCQRSLDLLGSVLGLRVEIILPLRSIGNLGLYARPDRSSDWAVATGLSLYPVGSREKEAAA